jgi:anti-sigma-K factor RskA
LSIKNYIASGIIESYLFGLATAEERLDFERFLKENAELRAEFNAVQETYHTYVKADSKPLPVEFKEQLWSKLEQTSQTPESSKNNIIESAEQMVVKQAPAIVRLMPFVAAASLALFSVSAYLAWDYHSKWKSTELRVASLEAEKNKIANDLQPLRTSNTNMSDMLAQLNQDGNLLVRLRGKDISPKTNIMVCWNKKDKDISLYQVSTLPAAPSGKQYQLWAIVDGKPVNAGMISEKDKDDRVADHYFTKVKIKRAEAFAITLEEEGGAEEPTMEAMYAIGEI